eukprot:g67096.t1
MPPPLPVSGCRSICTQACLIVMKITSSSSSRMKWAFDCTQNHRNRCSGGCLFPSNQTLAPVRKSVRCSLMI